MIHPNWFGGFATVLEFQVGFLDLGKYWKAKNNGESQLAFVNNNTAEGLNPSLRFVIPSRFKIIVPTENIPSEKPKSLSLVNCILSMNKIKPRLLFSQTPISISFSMLSFVLYIRNICKYF